MRDNKTSHLLGSLEFGILYLVLSALCILYFSLLSLRQRQRLRQSVSDVSVSQAIKVLPFGSQKELSTAAAAFPRYCQEDQYLEAGTIIQRLQSTVQSAASPLMHAAKAVLDRLAHTFDLELIVRRDLEARTALEMILEQDQAWRLIASSNDGSRTYMRRENGLLWSKVVAELPVPMTHALAVCREAQLYHTWYPSCVASNVLSEVSQTEFLAYMELKHDLPMITLCEDTLIHFFSVDCTESHGGLLALGKSPQQESWPGTPFPPKAPGRHSYRTELEALQFFCEPCSDDKCSVTLQMAVEDKLIPDWVLDFIFKRVLAKIFGALSGTAKELASEPCSAHAKLIAEKSHMYHDLLPRKVAACTAGQQRRLGPSDPSAAELHAAALGKRKWCLCWPT